MVQSIHKNQVLSLVAANSSSDVTVTSVMLVEDHSGQTVRMVQFVMDQTSEIFPAMLRKILG